MSVATCIEHRTLRRPRPRAIPAGRRRAPRGWPRRRGGWIAAVLALSLALAAAVSGPGAVSGPAAVSGPGVGPAAQPTGYLVPVPPGPVQRGAVEPAAVSAPRATDAPLLPREPGGLAWAGPADAGPCGVLNVSGCVSESINSFLRQAVTDVLNPSVALLASTLLTTPEISHLPRVGELWDSSWQILLSCYALLVMLGGLLVMAQQGVGSRYAIREMLPRLACGFLAGAGSLLAAGAAIRVANTVSVAVVSGGVDPDTAARGLGQVLLGTVTDRGGFLVLLLAAMAGVLLIAVLTGYLVRVSLTIILVAGAPLALMWHALPQTEGVARWWWRAFGGCLAIQIVQSLTLITALRVLLVPDGLVVSVFGASPTAAGLVTLLVTVALLYILWKIPCWVLATVGGPHGGGSVIGSLARGYLSIKTAGVLRGSLGATAARPGLGRGGSFGGGPGGGPQGGGPFGGGPRGGPTGGGSPVGPYGGAAVSGGRRRGLSPSGPRRTPRRHVAPGASGGGPPGRDLDGRQPRSPRAVSGPEQRLGLGRDGPYRPSAAYTTPADTVVGGPATASPPSSSPRSSSPSSSLSPSTSSGVSAGPAAPSPGGGVRRPSRPSASGRAAGAGAGPVDPYRGNRALRGGQYPLPLEGLTRHPRTPTAGGAPATRPGKPRPGPSPDRAAPARAAPSRGTPPAPARRKPPPPAPAAAGRRPAGARQPGGSGASPQSGVGDERRRGRNPS